MKLDEEVELEDLMLIFGIILFLLLVFTKGLTWVLEFLAIFFVSVTILDWIRSKIRKYAKRKI